MGWNLEQFNALCISKKLLDCTMYQKALFWKQQKVNFLVLQSKEVWNNFWQEHFWQNNGSINFQEQKVAIAFKDAQFQSETYIEAVAQNLHSMVDVLCQVINQVVLGSRLHEADVDLRKTIEELQKKQSTQDIVTALEELRDSPEFKYIAAFVNTIKHRRLLDTEYYGEFGQDKSNIIGIRFLGFEYEKPKKLIEKYDDTFAETITDIYMQRIFALIDSVGKATDTYIRHEIS